MLPAPVQKIDVGCETFCAGKCKRRASRIISLIGCFIGMRWKDAPKRASVLLGWRRFQAQRASVSS